jgi:hypothetical protein
MAESLEWLQLPTNQIEDTLKNKQLTAKLLKIVELARQVEGGGNAKSVSSKGKVCFSGV